MKKFLLVAAVAAAALVGTQAAATPASRTSPTGGAVPAGVTEVGGVVLDLKGLNGTRIVSQTAASALYVGFADNNPLVFGSQGGFDASLFGGGLASASVRITLYDGDSAPGDFDDGSDNTLFIDGANFGSWSSISTQETSSNGLTVLSSGTGFGNNILSTGWFSTSDATQLGLLFAGLGDGSLQFKVSDVDPYDNFYDFTQGVDGGLIDVGTGPVVVPPGGVPEPATWAMMIIGFGLAGSAVRGQRRQSVAAVA